MAAANDLRKGMCIRYNGNPAIVLEVQHRTPGNLRAFVQAIIRYIGTGKSADVRFGSTDKVESVEVHRQKLEFSYKDPQGYHFMDPASYETVSFDAEFIGDAKDYLNENLGVEVLFVEGKPASVDLPSSVNLKVTESADGVRGDSANNVQKPAVLETGKVVTVPLFIKAPGQRRGTTSSTYARTIDVLPTIADLLHFRLPYRADGASAFSKAVRSRRFVRMEESSLRCEWGFWIRSE